MSDPVDQRKATRKRLIATYAGFVFPLFFVVCFPLAYVSAIHAPAPNDLQLTVVGPTALVGQIADGLDTQASFSVEETDVTARAHDDVADRASVGAILVSLPATTPAPDSTAAPAPTPTPAPSASATPTTTPTPTPTSTSTPSPTPTPTATATPAPSASVTPGPLATTAAVETAGDSGGAARAAGVPSGTTVTVYIANGGGRAAAAAVQAVGTNIATQLGVTADVKDVAPLAKEDPLGTSLFFLLTYSSIGAYLLIVILTQMFPQAPLRGRYGAVAASSIIIPLFVFGLSSIFVGDYGASFGHIMALLGVDALYVFTVGSIAILLQSILGRAAVIGLMGIVVFLNLPSSGGTMPASMLPDFWQGMHSFWFGSGAFESFRSIIYFNGDGVARWLPQLLIWALVIPLMAAIVELIKSNRALKRRLEENEHRHARVASVPETASVGADRVSSSGSTLAPAAAPATVRAR